ncbi:PP2C family protein-serine/threonine phosphatase [Nereida sp. MMG025]|uniref:PP2C family protein-serine/threonine phosphatase n=1 Tax=Nereida sp. MMG025 TaxID=2909981 RepID=UPI001F02591D|nr:SpoIIE family protein phosphatase [Nereida sp. MMG025]MCF6444604.1 SpoIIE family protein phosphatase [Nereida sp. MMG025]
MFESRPIEPALTASQKLPDRKALVIDDSRMQRRILNVTLRKLGYHVREAASGIEALCACEEDHFDLILSDWMMPEMSGPQFCEAFRKKDNDRYSYIILLTSKGEKEDIAFGLQSGADDFLTKPVNSGELTARIAAGQRIVEMQAEVHRKNQEVNAALDEIRRLYNLLDSDLLEAKKLQLSLLPDRAVCYGPADVSLLLQSCGHVGGDLVGHFPITPMQFGFFSLDVSGHGISSALLTARLAGYFSGTDPRQNVAIALDGAGCTHPHDPAHVVESLNKVMLNSTDTDHYFTVLYGVFDITSGVLRFCQAGHPHPVAMRADGSLEQLGNGGLPVGLIEHASYETTQVKLSKGDRFITVSDGLTEAILENGDLLGEQGLINALADNREKTGKDFLETLVWSVSSQLKDDFDDDVSALMISAPLN